MSERKQNWYTRFVKWFGPSLFLETGNPRMDAGGGSAFTLFGSTKKGRKFSLGMKDIGCATLTKINIEEKTVEGGVFCGDAHYLKHWINIWACLKIYDYAFFELKLDTAYATILTDNKAALSLNKSLGYTFIKHADENVGRFELKRGQYISKSKKIRRYLNDFARQLI